jgi:hypothetical protein
LDGYNPVFLSAVRVPASRDERKSKDPEQASLAMRFQGVLLNNLFLESKIVTKNYRSLKIQAGDDVVGYKSHPYRDREWEW